MPVGHSRPAHPNGFYVNENGSVATDPYDVVPYYLVGEGFPLPHTQTDFI